jgi:hypothetical protein
MGRIGYKAPLRLWRVKVDLNQWSKSLLRLKKQTPLAQLLKRWRVQLFQVAHAAARQLDQTAGLCIGFG